MPQWAECYGCTLCRTELNTKLDQPKDPKPSGLCRRAYEDLQREEAMSPDIPEDYALELKVLTAANDKKVPGIVRDILREIWDKYSDLQFELEQLRMKDAQG